MNGVGDTIPVSYFFEADTAVLKLEYISGDEQIGYPDSTLTDSLVVRVVDQNDEVVPNIPVRFIVKDGNGSLSDSFVPTDSLGLAKVAFTLGNDSTGRNRVLAYLLNNAGDTLVDGQHLFTAYSDPDTMFYAPLAGNFQTGTANTVLPLDLRVQVNSVLSDDPQEDILVFFEVVSGGGSLSAFGTSTNSDGIAAVAWTLGPDLSIRQQVKAWAIDPVYGDTLMGGPLNFYSCGSENLCPPSATDVDGNEYSVAQIGCQCWFQNDLVTTHFSDGSPIDNRLALAASPDLSTISGPIVVTAGTDIEFYNAAAVLDPRGLCPVGYHVANDDDWKQVELFHGMTPSDVSKFGYQRRGWGNIDLGSVPVRLLMQFNGPLTPITLAPGLGANHSIYFDCGSTFSMAPFPGNYWSIATDGTLISRYTNGSGPDSNTFSILSCSFSAAITGPFDNSVLRLRLGVDSYTYYTYTQLCNYSGPYTYTAGDECYGVEAPPRLNPMMGCKCVKD
jgi:hypothetical protein